MPPTRSPTIATHARPPGMAAPLRRAAAVPAPLPPVMHELVLFVSCVDGKPVSRLPLPGRPAARELIGCVREGRVYKYDEEEIVGLTRAEMQAHGRVYERLIAEGYLRRRTRADFDAWQAALRERERMAAAAAQTTPAAPAGGEGS